MAKKGGGSDLSREGKGRVGRLVKSGRLVWKREFDKKG
jgi:hypothetical protein